MFCCDRTQPACYSKLRTALCRQAVQLSQLYNVCVPTVQSRATMTPWRICTLTRSFRPPKAAASSSVDTHLMQWPQNPATHEWSAVASMLVTSMLCNNININNNNNNNICELVQASCAVLTVWRRGGFRWWLLTRRTSWTWTTPCWPGCWTLMLSLPSSGYVLLTHSHTCPPLPPTTPSHSLHLVC